MIEYSAGIVTAYGSAVRAGYTGTYEDFCRQQAQYANNALAVEQAKETAVSASQSADQAKQDAQTASTTAQQSAQSAGQSAVDAQTAKNNAQTYAQSASASAGSAQQSAQTAQAVLESIPEDYSDLSEDVDKLKADLSKIIRHETDSIADNAYSVGEYFFYDVTNSFFKVKADISVGDTISTATNVTNIPYTSIVNYLYGLTEDLKTYTKNALEKTEDVRVLALDSYKIYENAKVTNGSKSYNETSITFTTLDTDTTINGVLFGNSTSDIEVSDEPYTSDTLVAEFDFTSTVDGVTMRVYGGSGVGTKTYNIVEGHNKIEFPKTHIQTVYFYRQHNTAVNTFTISNFILYQGNIAENPFAFVKVPKRFNKIFTVGDSLTNITGNAGQGKNRWQDVVIEKCGFTGFVKEGGVGYTVATYSGQTSIWECVEALVVNNEVDFVTFWGGTNDWSRSIPIGDFDANLASPDTATFYGAYISCVRKLLTLYPSKRIILIGTTPRMLNSTNADWSTDGTTNSAGNTLMDFTNAVKTVAEYYGLPYLDLLHTSGINKINYATFLTRQQHSGDNFYYYLHFTEEGELRIGDTISGFINSIIG